MIRIDALLLLSLLVAGCAAEAPGAPAEQRPPSWEQLRDRPGSFPPAAHAHRWSEILEKPDAFFPAPHVHNEDGEVVAALPITTTTGAEDGNSTLFLEDKRLHLRTKQQWIASQGHLSDLVRLQWTAPRAKPAISWLDETGAQKAAIVTHREANNPLSADHRHLSIETTMDPEGPYAGQLFTRMEFPYDADIAEIQVHSARFTIDGNFMRISGGDGSNKELRLGRTFSARSRPSIYPRGLDENGVGIGMPDYAQMYSPRWAVRADGSGERGGNTGSDFRIVRFDDEGNALDNPLFISRASGAVGVNTTSPTTLLDVNGDRIRIRKSRTPRNSHDPAGDVGDIAWDDKYVYVKTGAGWRRSALEAF